MSGIVTIKQRTFAFSTTTDGNNTTNNARITKGQVLRTQPEMFGPRTIRTRGGGIRSRDSIIR